MWGFVGFDPYRWACVVVEAEAVENPPDDGRLPVQSGVLQALDVFEDELAGMCRPGWCWVTYTNAEPGGSLALFRIATTPYRKRDQGRRRRVDLALNHVCLPYFITHLGSPIPRPKRSREKRTAGATPPF